MSAYYLFLDDERKPSDVKWENIPLVPWTIVRSYDAFVHTITKSGLPLHITFDHDLGQEHYDYYRENAKNFHLFLSGQPYDYSKFREKTGYDCAKWLIEYCLDNKLTLPPFTVHSYNPVGKKNILDLLNNFKQYCERS